MGAITVNPIGFLATNILFFLLLWGIGLMLLYTIIRIAVRNGVREANEKSEQHLQSIQDLVFALTKSKYTKPEE